jgi:hypothetical protein
MVGVQGRKTTTVNIYVNETAVNIVVKREG